MAATDGYPLAATLFRPAGRPPWERLVLIISAMGVQRRYYRHYASYLAAQGLPVLTFDYRGIGDSKRGGLRGFEASITRWATRDLDGVLVELRRDHPATKLLAVGHSVGGQVVGLANHNRKLQGLVGAAAQSGYWGHWPVPNRYLMLGLWYVLMPGLTHLLGYFPAKKLRLAENLPRGVALEWSRWGRHPDYITHPDGRPIRSGFEAFTAPIRYFSVAGDNFAPRPAVEALMSFYRNAPREGTHLTPRQAGVASIGHFGLFREPLREAFWTETCRWLRSI